MEAPLRLGADKRLYSSKEIWCVATGWMVAISGGQSTLASCRREQKLAISEHTRHFHRWFLANGSPNLKHVCCWGFTFCLGKPYRPIGKTVRSIKTTHLLKCACLELVSNIF